MAKNINQNKLKLTHILILLLLVLTIILTLACVLVKSNLEYQEHNKAIKVEHNYNGEKLEKETEHKEEQEYKEIDYSKEIDISGWNKYQSDEYGFEISYPSDWKLGGEDKNITLISPQTLKFIGEQKTRFDGEDYGPWGVDIAVYYYFSIAEEYVNKANKLGATTIDELIEKDDSMEKIGGIKIDNRNAVETVEYGEGVYYNILVENNGHLYKIFFGNIDLKREELSETEKRILSTLKFI